MKNILAFTSFAVTGFLVYCILKNDRSRNVLSNAKDTHVVKEHHLTNVFSKAKRYASEGE
ncbi:MAG: hypothetical protein M3R50_06605 [Bacteroidota bacterium]|nr:hypothetical protein [Bacteroidota bacterium]